MYGPVIAFALFFFQAVVPVIPYIIIAGAAGMIYGKVLGFLLAWIGALLGAIFLYSLSRPGSKFFISKISSYYKYDLGNMDEKRVFGVLLISRIFPIVPTPIINIGSGLSRVSFKTFTLSSAIGKLPWAFVYVALGDYLIKTENIVGTILVVLLILLISVLGIGYYRKQLPFKSIRK